MIRTFLIGLTAVAGLYLIFVLVVYVVQRSLLYFPDQNVLSESRLKEAGFEAVIITATSGGNLTSLWRAPKSPDSPVLQFFHGNAGSHFTRIPVYRQLAAEGSGVLAAGYPGYGGNSGRPSEASLHAAAQAHYDWLIAQDIAPERIVLVGESLGSGIATRLAAENRAAGLILLAAYTGMDDIAQSQFPLLPARWLIKDRYRSIDHVAAIRMPLSWIHGRQDTLIPFAMGQTLFDAAREPKTAHSIAGAGHNDLWQHGADELVHRDAATFVAVASAPAD